jgi:acetolactate decarboxylase
MRFYFVLCTFAFAGCSSSYTVTQHGGMRDALREGNTEARISFEEISSKPHAFAVGALADLEGEITVVDGKIIVAKTSDGKTAISSPASGNESATLLTLAYVKNWTEDILPPNLTFEEAVEVVAKRNGIDTDKPFPFYVNATTTNYEMHVINGFCPVASPDLPPEDQPWRLHGEQTEMLIVGFFAKNQEGVMTHHGSNIHIHGLDTSRAEGASGHLDSVNIAPGSTIFVPRK